MNEGNSMTRAEWIAAAAILLNLATLVFGGGAFWQTVQGHDDRLTKIEANDLSQSTQFTEVLVRLERIDANTTALKERMGDKP